MSKDEALKYRRFCSCHDFNRYKVFFVTNTLKSKKYHVSSVLHRNTCAPESYRMLNGKKAFFTSKSEPTTPESSRKHYTSTPLVRYPSLETEKWQDPSENPHENEDYKKSVMKKRHKGLCYIPIEDVEKETVL